LVKVRIIIFSFLALVAFWVGEELKVGSMNLDVDKGFNWV